MTYEVVLLPEAEEQLLFLREYIAVHASEPVAARYVEGVISFLQGRA